MIENQVLDSIYNELKYRKKVSGKVDFGRKLGYGKSYFSQLMNGALPITDNVIGKLQDVFGINRNFVLTGNGDMFLPATRNNQPGEHLYEKQNFGLEQLGKDWEHLRRLGKETKAEEPSDETYKAYGKAYSDFASKINLDDFSKLLFNHELRIRALEEKLKDK